MTILSSSTYLVTGAASGIGLAVAQQLTDAGADVIGLDRRESPVPGVRSLVCDLSSYDSIAQAADHVPDALAGIANVAGVPGTADPATVLAVNLLGPRTLTGLLLERIESGGAVVNASSVAAHRNLQPDAAVNELLAATSPADIATWLEAHPVEGPAAYDTSKRALNDWTTALAAAQIEAGRRALTVSPGPTETPILDDFRTSMGVDSIARAAGAVGRHGTPDEIAGVIVFCLSRSATWLNGIDIPVEGGLGAVRAALNLPATSVVAPEQGASA